MPLRIDLRSIGVGILGFVLLIIGVVVFSPPALKQWLQQWDELLLGASSAALSAFLVLLYSKQQDVLAANHRAVVEVDQFETSDDNLILRMSNFGHGVATDTELVIASVFYTAEDLKSDVVTRRLSRSKESGEDSRYGQSLQAGDSRRRFKAHTGIPLGSGHQQGVVQGFQSGVHLLGGAGVEVIRLHFYVRYRDLLRERHIRHFYSLEFDADAGYESLEEASEGGGGMLYGEPEIDADDLTMDMSDAVTGEERTVI